MTNSPEEILFNYVVTSLLSDVQDRETIYGTFLTISFSSLKTC